MSANKRHEKPPSKNEVPSEKKLKKNSKLTRNPKERNKVVTEKGLKSNKLNVSEMDVSELLALGEGTSADTPDVSMNSDSDESDWEEVEDLKDVQIPKEGVNITVELPGDMPRKKKKADLDDIIKREMNRVRRELQLLVHKTHLLCWLAHIKFINNVLNSQVLMALSVSIVTSKNCYPPKYADLQYLELIVKWYSRRFTLKENKFRPNSSLVDILVQQFDTKVAVSSIYLVYVFVIILRSFGLQTRVIHSLQVASLKPGKELVVKKVTESVASTSKEVKPAKRSENVKKKPVKKSDNKKKNMKDEEFSPHFVTNKKNIKQQNVQKPKISKFSVLNKSGIDRRVLSSDEDEDNVKGKYKQCCNVWVEVFLESEEKWISVDVIKSKIHCVNELYAQATHPVLYVIGCNNDSTLKDLTQRYVPNWHSDTKKHRVEDCWWKQTIKPYLPRRTAREREEDEDIAQQLNDKPIPTSVSQLKGHPLYVLKRHLLKFEGIYPADAPPLGFVKDEPVYARECVHLLRSRENWHKEARVVKAKETPYKIVKARPKFDKMTGQFKTDLPLELFGRWQTEDYVPPDVVDGKVPRNEYGNVELFKPCMLPKGAVHLKNPGLFRIAKKLGIDCANAMVGFDFHSGGCHAVYDGVVVCAEFKDVLLDAWNEDMLESSRKEEEKREKRVYDNWKRLIRGLLIREKLKLKYAFGVNEEASTSSNSIKKLNKKKPK